MHEAPVREHEHVLPVVSHRIGGRWVDDDRPVMTELFLQTGMAVVPEGARLLDRELVMIGFTWPDAGEADARHPVHLEGQEQPMPVDRAVFVRSEERRVGKEGVITCRSRWSR